MIERAVGEIAHELIGVVESATEGTPFRIERDVVHATREEEAVEFAIAVDEGADDLTQVVDTHGACLFNSLRADWSQSIERRIEQESRAQLTQAPARDVALIVYTLHLRSRATRDVEGCEVRAVIFNPCCTPVASS